VTRLAAASLFVFSESEPGSSCEWSPDGTSPTTRQAPVSQLALESGPRTYGLWATEAGHEATSTAHTRAGGALFDGRVAS
jgi:hypothetical protein